MSLLLLLTLGASAFPPVYSVPTDPTEFGSLRLDPFESIAPDTGEWIVIATAAYFNQWNGTWHTRRSHEDRGLRRQPIQDEELRALEAAFPEDEIFRVDLEGTRMDLLIARGFRSGAAVQLRVPWISTGTPSWDALAEGFHRVVPIDAHYVRDLFPRGQTFFYLRSNGRSTLHREELARAGVGDIGLTVGVPLRQGGSLTQRVAFAVELPTGRENTLHGSGGFDAGIRWFGLKTAARHQWVFGAGISRQDPAGSFLDRERTHTAHLSADFQRRLGGRVVVHAAARLDTSPLSAVSKTSLGDPVLYYRVGLQMQMPAHQWLSFELGEEFAPQIGVDADFSFHFGYVLRLAR